MAVTINVYEQDLERLYTEVRLSGLTVGAKYDVYRMKVIYNGDDPETHVPRYDRSSADRKTLWSSVAHRIGWTAPAATTTFRDYESPGSAFSYFVVATSAVAPFEYNWAAGPYPLSRGVLGTQVVNFNRDYQLAYSAGETRLAGGDIIIRSTVDLVKYVTLCVESLDIKYQARGTEQPVMKRQYPLYVSDTREARRGTLVVVTKTLTQYRNLRDIVFPASGKIQPVQFDSGPGSTLMLDDMRIIPLDVGIEQAGRANIDMRFVSIDFIETDPTAPLLRRAGDNDDLAVAPKAHFAISDITPRRNQVITLTDASTGQYEDWTWTIERGAPGARDDQTLTTKGPHRVSFYKRGKHAIKLRVGGSGQGYSTMTHSVTVW